MKVEKMIKFLLFKDIRNLLKIAILYNFIKYLHFMILARIFLIKEIK